MKYLKGTTIRPVYKKLLAAAIAAYIVGSCIIQADLCHRLGEVEHKLCHTSCSCGHARGECK
ncbi:MAG: hypothetical protein WC738_03075 [Candidatus Omnitrophota bacterium]